MTKYEILSDRNKVWDKTLAQFMELFSLRKAYGDDKAANSGFESAAHVRDHAAATNTKSDFTRDLYIESLEDHPRRPGNNLLRTPPGAHPHHWLSIPSRFSKPNLPNNASRYWKSWHRMQNSLQHSPRVVVVTTVGAAAAKAKVAAVTTVINTKPLGKKKNSA